MKTLLQRMKTAVQGNSTLAAYVNSKNIKIVAPRTLPELGADNVPFIGLAPITSPEEWKAQRKEATHTVEAYLVQFHLLKEDSIMGTDARKGILDFVADFESVIRGHQFPSDSNDATTNYLSKPTDITNVSYTTEPYGDNYYLLIATVSLLCVRLFNV